MKKLLIFILLICSYHGFSQTLTVVKQGNTVVFNRSGQESIVVGGNEFFDCYRYSNDTTKITFNHARLNNNIFSKTNVLSVGGVSTTTYGAWTIAWMIKDLVASLNSSTGGSTSVVSGSISVSNFPATQPVSGTVAVSNPITGFATETTAGTLFKAGQSIGNTVFGATQSGTWSVGVNNFPSVYPVTGTFWQTTQPVSASSLPLPAGASTETTTNTLFKAGQNIGNTAFIANAGTNLNTSALALETGGNLATIAGKDFATETTLSALNGKFVAGTTVGNVGLIAGTNTIGNVNQTQATAGFSKLTDGTNDVSIKAASTAPVLADKSLVVGISPNSPNMTLPGGTTATYSNVVAGTFATPALGAGQSNALSLTKDGYLKVAIPDIIGATGLSAVGSNLISASSSTTGNSKIVMVANVGSAAGIFNGTALPVGASVFLPKIDGFLYPAITIDGTGTILFVVTIQ
jgi:hypothetical protein